MIDLSKHDTEDDIILSLTISKQKSLSQVNVAQNIKK